MGAKTTYVKQADSDLWARAEAYAGSRTLTMSALILSALETYPDEAS